MDLKKFRRRVDYYQKTLISLDEFGGHSELVRGVARMVLRKPSDSLRKFRWKLLSYRTGIDSVIIRFPKFKLAVDANDEGIAADLAIDHIHEPTGTKILQSIIQSRHAQGMTTSIIEIGSNIGYFAMQEATQPGVDRIFAIEPNPHSFEFLCANVKLNNFSHFDLFNIGISNVDGELPFYISKHSNLSSITPRRNFECKLDVPVMRLDSFVERERINKVDMIRMDIEGHEICVLNGMIKTLQQYHPWVCLEYHSPMISEQDREYFVSTFERLGYELKCFIFRWSDCLIFGRTIMDKENVIKQGTLRDVLNRITKQVLLIFLAPADTPFDLPKL